MSRIVAACLAIFGLANAIAGFYRARLDANLWWIDLRWMPDGLARACLAIACVPMLGYALYPEMQPLRRIATLGAVTTLATACLANGIQYYALLYRGSIHSSWPMPISALTATALIWICLDILRNEPRAVQWRFALPVLCACLIGFPLAQIFLFGTTDYRRPADTAIVFGARVCADGRPSAALCDRVRTACDLYRQRVVSTLIFSGGPGDGPFHETDVMRSLALQWGVSDSDIVLDREGVNTRASLEFIRIRLAQNSIGPRVLAVSHFYHLPRIKLESQRLGIDVLTVPAKESYTLTKMPILIAREVAALWQYYLRPPA